MLEIFRNNKFGGKPLLQDNIFFGQPDAEKYFDSVLNEISAEKADHQLLIELGGRPMNGPNTIVLAAENQHQFKKLDETFPSQSLPMRINSYQLKRWIKFRTWQNCTRGIQGDAEVDEELWLREYDQLLRRKHVSFPQLYYAELAALETDEGAVTLEQIREDYLKARSQHRAEHKMGFEEWVSVANRIMAACQLSWPFRLDKNPKKQGKLTTWLEYYAYENHVEAWRQREKREEARRALNEAWNKLQSSPHFSPNEKKSRYMSAGLAQHVQLEVDNATKALVRREKAIAQETMATGPKEITVELEELEIIQMQPGNSEELQEVVLELAQGLKAIQDRNASSKSGKSGQTYTERARHGYLREQLYELQMFADRTYPERRALEIAQERLDIVQAIRDAKAEVAKKNRKAPIFSQYLRWIRNEIPFVVETERTGQWAWQFDPVPDDTTFERSHEDGQSLNLPAATPEPESEPESPARPRDYEEPKPKPQPKIKSKPKSKPKPKPKPKPKSKRKQKKRGHACSHSDDSEEEFRPLERQKKRSRTRSHSDNSDGESHQSKRQKTQAAPGERQLRSGEREEEDLGTIIVRM